MSFSLWPVARSGILATGRVLLTCSGALPGILGRKTRHSIGVIPVYGDNRYFPHSRPAATLPMLLGNYWMLGVRCWMLDVPGVHGQPVIPTGFHCEMV